MTSTLTMNIMNKNNWEHVKTAGCNSTSRNTDSVTKSLLLLLSG